MSSSSNAYEATARLHHAFLTGLILHLVARRGAAVAAEFVFRLFRRKHLEQFLPGIEKLGLGGLPHAVACAQYHYLSNQLGGVKVEYIPESDRKAWVRYPPPRWIWAGTAIAGIPSEVSAAVLRGWHGHNGVSLGNPRLGFVCTKQTVDGQPGLEGYYYEHDRPLAEAERLRFAPDEEAPPFDPARAPRVPAADWPAERLAKAHRNYAMDYVGTAIGVLLEQLGEEGAALGGAAARLIGMHLADEMCALVGCDGSTADGFAELFQRVAAGQGDEVEISRDGDTIRIEQRGHRLLAGSGRAHPSEAGFRVWNELWVGASIACDRFLEWHVETIDLERPRFTWRLTRRTPPSPP